MRMTMWSVEGAGVIVAMWLASDAQLWVLFKIVAVMI